MKKGAKSGAFITCFVLLLMLAVYSSARADTSVNFVSNTPAGGGLTDFSYSFTVDSGTVLSGNYFTIYDIPGLHNVTVPNNWGYDITFPNIGTTPSGVSPLDDPNIPNVTIMYSGGLSYVVPLTISGFHIFSTDSLTQTGVYATRNSNDPGFLDTTGSVLVPAAVPEASTMLLLGFGLIGLVGYGKRRFFKK